MNWIEHLRNGVQPQLFRLLETAANLAEQQGCQLYLVGGVVRDLLLAESEGQDLPDSPDRPENLALHPIRLSDIDLVVDGCSGTTAAGVALAQSLQQRYPAATLTLHGQFQTAALQWPQDSDFPSLGLDIATARTEVYPHPAANPVVSASSIRQDLYRRDFTINALAISLTPPRSGELLDCFGGVSDLHRRQLRVLHAQSFVDDPTRVFRAVRFALRLRFELEPQTREYFRLAIASGIYERTRTEHPIAPALQTRLRAELTYTLEANYWQQALKLLGELDALHCLHPSLDLTPALWRRVRLGDRLARLWAISASQSTARKTTARKTAIPPLWLMRLELLLRGLGREACDRVATQLRLSPDSLQRLADLENHKTLAIAALGSAQRPSQIYQALKAHSVPTLLLLAAEVNPVRRRQIWLYLAHWKETKAPLNGKDLQAMGYASGPQFQVILNAVLMAYLDGELGPWDAPRSDLNQAARRLLDRRFPQELRSPKPDDRKGMNGLGQSESEGKTFGQNT